MLQIAIYLFYSFFLLTGGFRNYTEELEMRNSIEDLGVSGSHIQIIELTELFGIICVFFILIFPFKKYLHLLFFGIFFPLSMIFQNFLFWEKYLIAIDFLPLLFFFLIHFQMNDDKIKQVKTIAIKLISIGYITSLITKTGHHWLHPDFAAVKTIVSNFRVVFDETIFSSLLLKVPYHAFHKLCDYLVLILQAIALFIFFKPAFFKSYSLYLVIFHTLIFLTFDFYFFFPYIILYKLLITEHTNPSPPPLLPSVLVIAPFALLFAFKGFDKFFFLNTFSVYGDTIGRIYFMFSLIFYFYTKNHYLYKLNK